MEFPDRATLRTLPVATVLRQVSGGVVFGIQCVAALIRAATGRYLITQRRSGSHLEGLWEFPGGKREAHESFEQCLRRELTEELAATFRVGKLVETVRWEYPDRRIVLHFYECHLESGTIEPRDGQSVALA